ncbi:hypothetical protein ACTXT7_002620 [Hymenolepis weldensis]
MKRKHKKQFMKALKPVNEIDMKDKNESMALKQSCGMYNATEADQRNPARSRTFLKVPIWSKRGEAEASEPLNNHYSCNVTHGVT